MAYTTINKSSDFFNTVLYTGNNADGNAITGVGHSPDFVWIKQRNAMSHRIYDKIRGVNSALFSDTTEATNQYSAYGQFESFDSDGFTVGVGTNTDGTQGYGTNQNSQSIVSWNWKANGAGSANTDGSINSTVSVNTTSGFSIVSYTGNGTGNSTIGHGLGATPKFIIVKNLTTAQDWGTYSPSFVSASDPNVLYLSKTSAQADDTNVWGTSATFNNNTFTVGDWTGSNQSGSSFIAYCFAEKTGYSKFGSYTGNGNDGDGVFIYTGFKPAFVIIKKSSNAGEWLMLDNKRSTFNVNQSKIFANDSAVENTDTSNGMDFLSNGIKLRRNNGESNEGGQSYIYMCFAEAPLVGSNNVPCTAR